MRTLLLSIVIASAALADPPHTSFAAVPKGLRAPLSAAIPRTAWLTWYGETAGVTTMRGNAAAIEDVEAFMRALASIVRSPKGLARILERDSNRGMYRVELIGPKTVIEYAPADLHLFFSEIELRSAGKKGDLVEFELNLRAAP